MTAPPPVALASLVDERDIHEEVTVARELPDLASYLGQNKGGLGKTLMDASPFGATQLPAEAAPAGDTTKKTQMMASTLADPEVAARAEQMRDALLTPAPPPPAAGKPALASTMVLGESPLAPSALGTSAPSAPSAPPAPREASPLSKSVAAPHSWTPPAPAPAASFAGTLPLAPAQGTQLGMPARDLPPPAAHPGTQLGMPARDPAFAAPEPMQHASVAQGAPALRTMFGMPASDLPPPQAAPTPHAAPFPQAPPPGQMPGQAPPPPPALKTMLGVAIPGIAPMHEVPPPLIDPADLRSTQNTMLGVAIPGIAPTHEPRQGGTAQLPMSPNPAPYGYTAQGLPAPAPYVPSQVQNTALGMMAAVPDVPIVPRPKTLFDEPAPVMPSMPERKGISALTVVGIVIALLAVGGGTLAFVALRRGATLTAVPQLDENGKESLKIACATCGDGTRLSLGASTTTVTGGNAVLPLPAPLTIGDNDLVVKIDRPGTGRDEDVKIHVPVAYRVRADLTTLSAKPPTITVRVEAVAGTEVKVEDKPITLDAEGKGSYAIDLSKETDGPGDAKPFERKIPFVVTPKGGAAQPGELTARTAVLSLALDAPGSELYVEKASAAIAGQTRPGATITVDGQNVAVDAQGHFGVRVELPAVGPKPLEIIASGAPQAPRIAKVKVTRVASLEAQAKELEGQSPIAYDAFGTDPASKVGQKAVVEGEVVDVRAAAGHTVLLVDSKRGCTKGAQCLVRIRHGDEDAIARGALVKAYGHVTGSVTANGKTVPEIEASLVQQTKAGK